MLINLQNFKRMFLFMILLFMLKNNSDAQCVNPPTVSFVSPPTNGCSSGFTLETTASGGTVQSNFAASSGLPLNIPDGGSGVWTSPGAMVSNSITVTGLPGTISNASDVTITMSIDHTWIGDLQVNLVTPSGAIIPLIIRLGATSVTSAGSSGNFVSANPLSFNSGASGQIVPTTGLSNVPAGTYLPSAGPFFTPGNLGLLAGENKSGTWTLQLQDGSQGDLGTLTAWSITFFAGGLSNYTHSISGSGTIAPPVYSGANNMDASTSITNVSSGLQTYIVTVTDGIGCTGTSAVSVNVFNAPTTANLVNNNSTVVHINEQFDGGTSGLLTYTPAGWSQQNLSTVIGITNWFTGNFSVFPAQTGAGYIAANFNNTSGANDISNWLISPNITLKNGDILTFWTRTVSSPPYADRLQVRLSTNGASTNVGSNATSVGDFTTLLLDINPTLTPSGYPNVWTQYTITISGLSGTQSGRIAFRYFVTNGGSSGSNSDYIGLDNVQYISPATPVCSNNVNPLAVNIVGGTSPYTVIYSDGSVNGSVTNYTSGSNIFVVPAVTTTYNLVSVTDANGCICPTLSGTPTVTISPATNTLVPVTTSHTQNQIDGSFVIYNSPNCDIICGVADNPGGNVLGSTIATAYVEPAAMFHNGQPYVRRWYEITPSGSGPATVTLAINQSDFNDYNAVVAPPYLPLPTSGSNSDPNIPNIRITKNDNTGLGNNPVVITPSSVTWNGNFWEIEFMTTSFSQFRIHSVNSGNIPLPVSLLSFHVKKQRTSDLVTWSTAQEINSASFTVERSSNGVDFIALGKVHSKAVQVNSHSILNYSFVDEHPQKGNNYYRLSQTDLDGRTTVISDVKNIIWNENGSIQVYPNPASTELNVEVNFDEQMVAVLKILDMSGRVLKEINTNTHSGLNQFKLDISSLSNGMYQLVIVEGNTKSSTLRFVKK